MSDSPTSREILTPTEVARIFKVDAKTVTRWTKVGKLNAFRTLGGHRRFYADEVYAAAVKAEAQYGGAK